MADANRAALAIAQIETATGIEQSVGIAAVEGIDVLLVGPNDLAVSLGCPGQLDSPQQEAAIQQVADAARNSGKIFGMHAGGKLLARWVPEGMGFIMNSLDVTILGDGFRRVGDEVRRLLPPSGGGREEKP